jgi:hypothetical protein
LHFAQKPTLRVHGLDGIDGWTELRYPAGVNGKSSVQIEALITIRCRHCICILVAQLHGKVDGSLTNRIHTSIHFRHSPRSTHTHTHTQTDTFEAPAHARSLGSGPKSLHAGQITTPSLQKRHDRHIHNPHPSHKHPYPPSRSIHLPILVRRALVPIPEDIPHPCLRTRRTILALPIASWTGEFILPAAWCVRC